MLLTALAGVLAAGCLSVAAFHLLRLVVARADPADEASHAAVGLGMSAMFSPLGDPVPAAVWVVVFVPCIAWFATVAVRTPTGPRRADAVHHVVGSGAMLAMLLGVHGGSALASAAAIVLAGYLGWNVLRCVDRLRAAPAATAGAGTVAVRYRAVAVRYRPVALRYRAVALRDPRVVGSAHVVMAAAMTAMVLGMV